ncbi:hypothetical protein D3C77_539200 [compost metagenome]
MVQFLAQFTGVEQLRVQGAATWQGTWKVRVVIRVFVGHRIAHSAGTGEGFNHLRCVVEVGAQAPLVHLITCGRLQIGQGQFGTVFATLAGEVMIVGNPDPAAGNRRSPPVLIALFHDQHAQPLVSEKHRRRHRASA